MEWSKERMGARMRGGLTGRAGVRSASGLLPAWVGWPGWAPASRVRSCVYLLGSSDAQMLRTSGGGASAAARGDFEAPTP